MPDYTVDCVIAGAGVVGLAIARELACAGREVVVLEKEASFGEGVSSRSSEVIHAGMYYDAGTSRAKLCVEGKWLLYDYCRAHAIPFNNCGKLIVATSKAEDATLDDIMTRGAVNGVDDLERLTAAEAIALEPELSCTSAILSPSTGVIDSHSLMFQYLTDAENAGAMFAFSTPFERARVTPDGFEVDAGGADPMTLGARVFINSAGLFAPHVAARIDGLDQALVPTAYYGKGSYFVISGKAPFSRLIYPVPIVGGLGVHVTIDMGGQVKFGPDAEWVETLDYTVDPARADDFYAAVRRYWPGLPDGALEPGYAGIRPKIVPPGTVTRDWCIQGPAENHVPGLVNLFGMESPGLTSSLAIGRHVAGLVG